jgi:hypothetical protein
MIPSGVTAYAARASVYWGLSQTGRMDPDEALPKMRSAAEKAVQLDPLLAEAFALWRSTDCWQVNRVNQ